MTKYTIGLNELTPVEQINGILFKRDDLFTVAGCYGGKARGCWNLVTKQSNLVGLVTAGHRDSPQICIVAHVGRELGLPVRAHTAQGKLYGDVALAKEIGADIVQWPMGYGTVLRKRAKDDGAERGYFVVPFGMQHGGTLDEVDRQMENLPWTQFDRLVTVCGSGMVAAGLLNGLLKRGMEDFPILVVSVGANRLPMLDKFVPDWRRCNVEVVKSTAVYNKHIKSPYYHGLKLDSIYEGKCIEFFREGDLFWVVGIHKMERDREC